MTGTRGARAPGLVATYRDVLAMPVARRLALVSLLSKFPFGMFPVSTVLLLSPRYSYGSAGAAVGVAMLANAVSSPMRGRIGVRRSGRAALLLCLAGYLTGMAVLAAGASQRLPLVVILLSAAATGACLPPVGILLRAHWTAVDRDRGGHAANAMESALVDITLVTSPVLATYLGVTWSPVLPFVAIGGLMAVSVLLLSAMVVPTPPARAAEPASVRQRTGALSAVFGAQLLFCAGLSAVEVALPIFAQQQHVTSNSGWYLAGLSAGSIVGALLLGASTALAKTGLPTLLGAFAAGTCLLGLAMAVSPVAVLVACPLAGLAIGTTFSRFYGAIGELTPVGGDGRVQGWATSVTTIGFAIGDTAGAALAGAHGALAFLFLTPLAGVVASTFVPRPARGRGPVPPLPVHTHDAR